MAVTIEVKEGQTATVDGPARMRVVGGGPDTVSIGGTSIPFPGVSINEGETADVVGPAILRVVSDVPGSVLIDGEPVIKPPEPPVTVPAPAITSLDPATAVAGDAVDIVMAATGTGFDAGSVIVFDGNDEPTTFIDETQVSTGVKPSLFTVAADCPVSVRNGDGQVSNELTFSFTDPVARSRR